MLKGKIHFKTNKAAFKKELLSSIQRMNNHKVIERNLKTDNNKLISSEINKLKDEMIKEFLNHPITKEILAGPNASNISGTLGGYGNLFSFIGFESGEKPIDPILALLKQTKYSVGRMNRGVATITVEIPSKEQIFAVTPLPWAQGLSWAERIEVGLSGLGMYMNKKSDYSRSGTGVQSSAQQRGGSFRNTKYISSFLNTWEKKFLSVASSVVRF